MSDTAKASVKAQPNPNCVEEWRALLYAGEKLFLAGARMRLGPNADLKAEYRRWYENEMHDHDQLVARVYDRIEAALSKRIDDS